MSHRQCWALCLLPFLERRGPSWTMIGGLRSSDRNSATTRDCTTPVRALFVGCMENCETKQLSEYPYEEAKFRHNPHQRPVAVLWTRSLQMDCGPAEKRRQRPLQVWEPGTCTRAGNAALSEVVAVFVGHIIARNFASLATASVLLERRDSSDLKQQAFSFHEPPISPRAVASDNDYRG